MISQSPVAGSELKIGEPVDLTISLGVHFVEVPVVTGMAPEAAETALTGAGLTFGASENVYIDTTALGLVGRTEPVAGSRIPLGSPVDLKISLGPWTGLDVTPPGLSITAAPDFLQAGESSTITVRAWDELCRITKHVQVQNGGHAPKIIAGSPGQKQPSRPVCTA